MTIAMDFAEIVEPRWNGLDGVALMDWCGNLVLVTDVPRCTNLNAPLDRVQSVLRENGVDAPTRADVVDAILTCRC